MNKLLSITFITVLAGCSAKQPSVPGISEGKNIVTENAMVVSAHPESSRIGAAVLRKGGNAVDAAVATEFALAVCYPEAGNIGGGGFMLIRTSDGKTAVIDYREKAPLAASRDIYCAPDGSLNPHLSTDSRLASAVPGTVDGMINAHSKYGKLSFRELIQPAIDLAENGFPVTFQQAEELNSNRNVFIERNPSGTVFVKDSLWKEGDLLVQKDLSRTLVRIRENGRKGFYSGETADLIAAEMKRGNGIITKEDLDEYRSVLRNSISAEYRGCTITSIPPPSSGGIILFQLLGMTEPYRVGKWGFRSAATIHLITEAERRSFADRSEYLGDPGFMTTGVEDLVDKDYVAGRMKNFNANAATPSSEVKPGIPLHFESNETTHYSVVDSEGNAVSATTTLNGTFGNSIVVEGAGFLLNNEMDDFSLKPGYPNMFGLIGGEVNSIAPGKRMLSSMTPAIVEKDGKLFLIVGSPGGSTIPTTVYQVITNIIDHGMNLRQAVDTARFHHQWLPDVIRYESGRIDSTAYRSLCAMGHNLKQSNSIGMVSAIMILDDGRKAGCGDRRGYNTSCGY